ncbi:hypothetical protein BELL_0043g00230 [Botrytis elliptica]|uniref:Uncharacterized protein n=1 Tax=Botrytis elliptica TaxID=278938 RepID=A0A4Z1K0W0_9HELO|nr:hypothetical protein BELL_0043g00230 [Botrytis elliptica]
MVEEVAGLCPACPRPVAETPPTGPHEREVLQYSWAQVASDNRSVLIPMQTYLKLKGRTAYRNGCMVVIQSAMEFPDRPTLIAGDKNIDEFRSYGEHDMQ